MTVSPTAEARARRRVRGYHRRRLPGGITYYSVPDLAAFADLHLIARLDGLSLVLQTGSGHYGAFRAGHWAGFARSLADACASLTDR